MNDRIHISQDDLALYALQALSDAEMAAVREHVSGCAECRDQLAELHGDFALVALSTEQHALPQGARERFVQRMSPARPSAPAVSTVVPITQGKGNKRPALWMGWSVAAALLLVSADLGVRVAQLSQQLDHATAAARNSEAANMKARELLEVLTAPSAQRVALTAGKTPPAPSARAVYLASRGALVMEASNLQALPENKTYELWVIPTSGAPIPAGLFRPDASGSGSVVLPAIPQGVQAKAFGITVEKAEGSEKPTLPIILAGAPAAGE